jgi:Na+/melibiose symporter-like transporter
MLVTILVSAVATHHRIPYLPGPDRQGGNALAALRGGIRQAFGLRPFRALFIGSTLIFAAFGVSTALALYMATYFWRVSTDQIFIFGIFAAVGIFGGLAFWPRVAARIDKRPTFLIGLVIFGAFVALPILFKVVGFFPAEDSPFYLPVWYLHGLGYAFGITATAVTGGSMMADVADADQLRHGRRREGIYFGAVSFTAKASVGIGAFVAGQVVEWVGLVRGMRPDQVPMEMSRMLGLVDGLVLLLIVAAATAAFSRYDLTSERHASIRAQLDAQQAAPPLG